MTWELLQSIDGTYAVDWPTVRRIINSTVRARKIYEHSEVVVESQTTINPLSWALPDIHSVETNWDRVRSETKAIADAEYMALWWNSHSSAREQIGRLRAMQGQTRHWKELHQQKLQSAQHATMDNIEKASGKYESAAGAARFVRDRSADTLMVGATVLSGGAAAPFVATLGAGSVLKGTAKYQDSGSVGAATMEFAGSLVFGAIPFFKGGQALAMSEQFVVVTCEAPWKVATAIVEGKSVTESLVAGGVKFADPLIGSLLKSQAVQSRIEKWVVPLGTRFMTGESKETVKKFATEATKKLVKTGLSAGAGAVAKPSRHPQDAPQGAQESNIANDAVLMDDWLLMLAIIDMDRGLGN